MPRRLEHARILARLPAASVAANKNLIMAPRREALRDAVRRENAELARLSGSAENQEALATFAAKRTTAVETSH